MQLTERLSLLDGAVASVIGCGGKTSLIARLAAENSHRSVLISPTTKMYPIEGSVGVFGAHTGKLCALPPRVLAKIVPEYSLSLLEADGSRCLPCKGWREDEPVIPPYTTHTIGIVTLNALGKPAREDVCLRLPLFLALTGLAEGAPITLDALEAMVCAPEGMFRGARGKSYIFVNQVEEEATRSMADAWLRGIARAYPGRFSGLLYGSVQQGVWREVPE